MKNAEFKDIVPLVKHLFWWVPENELKSLSPDTIVETALSNGNEDSVANLVEKNIWG